MKIAIWGAGRFGKTCCEELKKIENKEIIAVIDSDKEKQAKGFLGFPVFSYESFKEQHREQIDGVVIGMMNGKTVLDIADILEKDGIRAYAFSNGSDSGLIQISGSGAWLPYLEYDVVDHCNLRCRGCLHFSNIEQESFADIHEFSRDMKQAKKRFGTVLRLRMMGGEPLLHRELDSFIKEARTILEEADIVLVTNGLLIEAMTEQLVKALKEYRVSLDITLYPPTARRWESIQGFLDKNQLPYRVSEPVAQFRKPLSRRADNDVKRAMRICDASGCTYISHGKIAKCPLAVRIEKFNKSFQEEIHTESVMDLYDMSISSEMMRDRLMGAIDLCAHCPDRESFQEWQTTGKARSSDWYAEES